MTRTDMLVAISRYCERQRAANTKPDVVARNHSTLQDFLREVQQDMDLHPDLFEHPHWAGNRRPLPPPAAKSTTLDCTAVPGAKVSLPTRGGS